MIISGKKKGAKLSPIEFIYLFMRYLYTCSYDQNVCENVHVEAEYM